MQSRTTHALLLCAMFIALGTSPRQAMPQATGFSGYDTGPSAVPSQRFVISRKGKNEVSMTCYGNLDRFDGNTLWLTRMFSSDGGECPEGQYSTSDWEVSLQPFFEPEPQPIQSGRIASSVNANTKDVDFQIERLQEQQRKARSNQPGLIALDTLHLALDLRSCRTRGTDVLELKVGDTIVAITGLIQAISNGRIDLKKIGQDRPQRYKLADVVSLTIGACQVSR